MKPSIVWASVAMLAYELYTLNSRGETWTDSVVKRDKRSVLIWSYWGWLGLHLITGGRI